DRSAPFCRPDGPASHCGRWRSARRETALRGVPRRRPLPSSLRRTPAIRRPVGKAPAARDGRHPPVSGDAALMSLLSTLGRKGLFLLDPETAHGMSIAALKAGIVP